MTNRLSTQMKRPSIPPSSATGSNPSPALHSIGATITSSPLARSGRRREAIPFTCMCISTSSRPDFAPTVAAVKEVAEAARKGEGNLRYDVVQSVKPPLSHMTLFAAWQNRKAFDSYEMSDYARQFRDKVGPLLGSPFDGGHSRRGVFLGGVSVISCANRNPCIRLVQAKCPKVLRRTMPRNSLYYDFTADSSHSADGNRTTSGFRVARRHAIRFCCSSSRNEFRCSVLHALGSTVLRSQTCSSWRLLQETMRRCSRSERKLGHLPFTSSLSNSYLRRIVFANACI